LTDGALGAVELCASLQLTQRFSRRLGARRLDALIVTIENSTMERYIDKDTQQKKGIVGKRATYNPPDDGAAPAAPPAPAAYQASRGTKRAARSLEDEESALAELVTGCRSDKVPLPEIAAVLHTAWISLKSLRASRAAGAPRQPLPRFGVSETAAPGGRSGRLVSVGAARVPKRARRAEPQQAAAAGKDVDADAGPRPRPARLTKAPRRNAAEERRKAKRHRAVPAEGVPRSRGAKAAGQVSAEYSVINMRAQARAGGFDGAEDMS
jgi:hypothetical protein